MYYAMRASAPSLHRESTDSLITTRIYTGHVYERAITTITVSACVINYSATDT